jgi:non-canonical (house-cleaning) NTP pyrophosphatase
MLILIGSKNPTKIIATETIFKKFFENEQINVIGININSDVPSQPIGLENVMNGAINRAKNLIIYVKNHLTVMTKSDLKNPHIFFITFKSRAFFESCDVP